MPDVSKNLKGLQPGQNYLIQVRAKSSDGEVSDWSNTYEFSTPADTLETTNSTVIQYLSGSVAGIYSATNMFITANGLFAYRKNNPITASNRTVWIDANTGNAYFSGSIVATSGSIGGWYLGDDRLWSDRSGSFTGLASNGSITFFSGATSSAGTNANFYVTNTGSAFMNAASVRGTIYGGSIFTGSITAGTASISGPIIGNGTLSGGSINVPATGSLFTVDSSGNMVAQSASITGRITASAGSIGGWVISSSALTSGNVGFYAPTSPSSSDIAIFAGSAIASRTSAPFRVDYAGNLTATNANISGSINATSGSFSGQITASTGSIGGFTIGANALTATNIVLSSANGLALGSASQFRVTQAGDLTATSLTASGNITASAGTIGGFTIGTDRLTVGSSPNVTGIYPGVYPFFAGATDTSGTGANFYVTPAGLMFSDSGSIAGWTIGATELYKGSGATRVTLDSSASPKIYIGSGNFLSADTGFYVDSRGYFSLSNQLSFIPGVGSASSISITSASLRTNSYVASTTFNNSTSAVVIGSLVTGSEIAINTYVSSVTYGTNASITLNNYPSASSNSASLTVMMEDFSELSVVGKIKGVIESIKPIASPKLFSTFTSASVNSSSTQILFGTNGHAFAVGEKLILEGLPATQNLNRLNYTASAGNSYLVDSTPNSTSVVVSIPSGSVTPGSTALTSGSISIQELTMGLHPAEGGTASHAAGTGIRLDRYNWWLTNNQFRVGTPLSYFQWNGTKFVIQGSGTKTLQLNVGSSDSNNFFSIVDTGSTPTYNTTTTPFYVDATGKFSLGQKVTWDGSTLNVDGSGSFTGNITASSGSIGGWAISASNISKTFNGKKMALGKLDLEGIVHGLSFDSVAGNYTNTWFTRDQGVAVNSVFFRAGDGALNSGSTYIQLDSYYTTNNTIKFNNGVFSVDYTGKVIATSGSIGGWSLGTNSLSSNSNNIILSNSGSISVGSAANEINIVGGATAATTQIYTTGTTASSGTGFYIDASGSVNIGNKMKWDGATLSVSGSVVADSGSIGSWLISSGSLVGGTGTSTVGLIPNATSGSISIFAGSATPSGAPFYVTNTGSVRMTNLSVNYGGDILMTSLSGTSSGANLAKLSFANSASPTIVQARIEYDTSNNRLNIGRPIGATGTSSLTNMRTNVNFTVDNSNFNVFYTSLSADLFGVKSGPLDGTASAAEVYSAAIYYKTAGSAAGSPLRIRGAGVAGATDFQIYRETSSLKYKKNVKDYDRTTEEILKLRPVFYNDKYDETNSSTYAGFIAEEVNEINLKEFVIYEQGEPETVDYARITAALIKVAKDQQLIINNLENRIKVIETMLSASTVI